MAKSLHEHENSLRDTIIDLQSDAHHAASLQVSRYNNLKMEMDTLDPIPHVLVNIAISEARYNLRTGEKAYGGLGPEERYVTRWLAKPGNLEGLMETWNETLKSRMKVEPIKMGE